MAEYNPSKIIKDGNTYNFRDTTKIPLAGSNAISGDLIPATTDAYDLGGPSYQWNNAYIKSLAINGVACGDILTHNVSEFVNVTGAQTIAGVKTFSDIPIVNNGKAYVSKINADRTNGTTAGFSAYNGFKIVCNNDSQAWNNTVFALHIPEYSPTSATVAFKLFDCIEGSSSYKGFGLKKINNDCQLSPTASNAIDLGSSTNKWKSLNGINPGALSLPSVSSGINLDFTNFKIDGSDNRFRLTSFSNYPYDNGWLFVRLNGCTSYYLDHWYKVVSNEYANPSTAIFFIPINDKDHDIVLRCVCTSINYIRIFPCQGNV